MAFVFVDSAGSGTDGDVSTNVALEPNGTATGNLLVVIVAANHSGGSFNVSDNRGTVYTGFGTYLPITGNLKFRIFYGILPTANPTITCGISALGNGEGLAAIVYAFTGSNLSTPLDVITAASSGEAQGNSTNPNPPAITPTFADSLVMAFGVNDSTDDQPGPITSYLGESGATGGAGSAVWVGAAYRILTGGAGVSQDPAAFSAWDTGEWIAISAVFRPPAQGGTSNMFAVF